MRHVSNQLPLARKKTSFPYLGDFLIAGLDVFGKLKK